MHEYKFVTVAMKTKMHLLVVRSAPEEDYHQIIHQHAKEGWRLVQVFAMATVGYGGVENIELIFEREVP